MGDVDDFLAHYGVKGMRWGVRKDDDSRTPYPKFIESKNKELARVSKSVLTSGLEDVESEEYRSKYGPGGLRKNQTIILAGVGIVGVGAAIYLLHSDVIPAEVRSALSAELDHRLGPIGAKRAMQSVRKKFSEEADLDISGLDMHWDKGVELPSGSILKRISTEREVDVRSGGFYAAFDEWDVERYKGFVPGMWNSWGTKGALQAGVINHYRSEKPIKAPSGEETVRMFRDILENPETQKLITFSSEIRDSFTDMEVENLFLARVHDWNHNDDPVTKRLFQEATNRGYNALIDFNNAGTVSKTPLRVIDVEGVSITDHEDLTVKDILKSANDFARDVIPGKGLSQSSDVDDFLTHYGVKGMRWGVRKDDPRVGRKFTPSGVKELDRVAKQAVDDGLDPNDLQSKYGPPGSPSAKKGLTQDQKIAIAQVGLVTVGIAGYLAYRNLVPPEVKSQIGTALDLKLGADFGNLKIHEAHVAVSVTRAKKGLDMHWDKGVELPPGAVLKRISTVRERDIRAGGFYAAFSDDDVTKYKAVLPGFWKGWGVGAPQNGGFVNNYKSSDRGVRAPSGKETYELFKDMLDNNASFAKSVFPGQRPSMNDQDYREVFGILSKSWNNDKNPSTAMFFNEVKKRGYNALIDFNDAGVLGDTPLRVIDPSGFNIESADRLSYDEIIKSANDVHHGVVHSEEGSMTDVDAFLAHYGVKGMKWGVRKDKPGVSLIGARKRKASVDAKEHGKNETKIKRNTTAVMSNKDLEKHIKRMNLEQQYAELTEKRAKRNVVLKGSNAVAGFLLDIGKSVLTDLLTDAAKNAASQRASQTRDRWTATQQGPAALGQAPRAINARR